MEKIKKEYEGKLKAMQQKYEDEQLNKQKLGRFLCLRFIYLQLFHFVMTNAFLDLLNLCWFGRGYK